MCMIGLTMARILGFVFLVLVNLVASRIIIVVV